MPVVTFINYDAKHRKNTQDDLSCINSHVAVRARIQREHEAEKGLVPYPMDSQIGGLRTDPFDMLPIDSTWDVPRALDYCEGLRLWPCYV